MALKDLIENKNARKVGVSEERVQPLIPVLRQYVAFWREYPDLFVDFMSGKDSNFHLYYYQRLFLRVACRYKYVYAVFPRAFSKSMLAILSLMIRCILYPGAKLFVAAGGKEQSSSIMSEKVEELCHLIPTFEREIDWRRGKGTTKGRDRCRYQFKNGSWMDNVVARESARGQRRHAGVLEECVSLDGNILNAILIPIMNIDRPCADGKPYKGDTLNKAQLYITTAGYKSTFAYEKLIQLLIRMVTEPDKAFIMGGTYRIPVIAGLQDADFVNELRNDGTYNDATFGREYRYLYSLNIMNCWESLRAA